MTPWLGISRPNYDTLSDGSILRAARVHPDEPVFSPAEWEAVVLHYFDHAPIEPPPQPPHAPARVGLPGFKPEVWKTASGPSFVTLLQVDAARSRVWVGDGQDKSLRIVGGRDGQTLWRLAVPSGPVSLLRQADSALVTLIGRVFPSDELAGQVWRVPVDGASQQFRRVLGGLRRPVHLACADLDEDGLEDMIVSAFGNVMGNLSWFRAGNDGGFTEEVLEEYPGTLAAVPTDWNRDGHPDLLVLRAQAREGLAILLNDGRGSFTRKPLIDEPPTHGYAALDLADLNGDGVDEILVVNGDSGDYPSPHKAFHGVRIYERTVNGMLVERYFRPINGAYGIRAADFDGDGDQDLAAIAFFPDFGADPLETMLLMENLGGWRFETFTLEAPWASAGRWLVMDAGDVDGDGDEDIVLGSFFRGPSTTPVPARLTRVWETNGVGVVLLRNTRR